MFDQGSVMGPLQFVSMYALQMIKKLQTELIASLAPKQSVTDAFNAHCQEWVKHTVWVEECRSVRVAALFTPPDTCFVSSHVLLIIAASALSHARGITCDSSLS
jgi:hypothetical protein